VSCLATRTGDARDAWLIEHQANVNVLEACDARHFVLLSAICVQRPKLAFQHAKLAAERAIVESGKTYSIVRPTAFFKSLSGQVEAVKAGKPFMIFGDGELTACKPISEADLARFIAACLEDPSKQNKILPVGGPGEAITPLRQGAILFELCGRRPRYRRIPVPLFDGIIGTLAALGHVVPSLRNKAERARIGRYYATESMLVFDERTGSYDASKTPSYGEETLAQFYARALRDGLAGQELGDHALFSASKPE
jgi:divinyl chlorophyllide a 8-vinyl-reductase